MTTPVPSDQNPIVPIQSKKTRRELQDEIRAEKAKIKAARKAGFRKKTEKKLAEKAERKIAHKRDNAKRKLEKKTIGGVKSLGSK